MNDNTYRKHIGDSVANHKSADHLSEDERKILAKLMSQFECLLQGTVGDFKEIEVSFNIEKDETPYHTKPYFIPVTHILLIK